MVESLLEEAPRTEPVVYPWHGNNADQEPLAGLPNYSVAPVSQGRRIALNLRFDSDWPALAGSLVVGLATGFLVGWMLARGD
jgi:hypothetical protein